MIRIYGIKQCDTCRKAIRWLDEHSVAYTWQDIRQEPLSRADIESWMQSLDWRTLVNKRSTTWRELDDAARDALSQHTVISQLLATPTLIKRPVAMHDGGVTIGFSENNYATLFA